MKRAIAAAVAGVALLGGQALAQSTGPARVADRVGAPSGDSSEFAGGVPAGLIFAAATVLSFYVVSQINDDDDDSESD